MISIVIRLLWIWSEPALIKAEWTCINKVRVTSTVTSVGSLLFLSTSISCRTGHRQLSKCFWFLRPGSDDLSGDWRLTYRKDYITNICFYSDFVLHWPWHSSLLLGLVLISSRWRLPHQPRLQTVFLPWAPGIHSGHQFGSYNGAFHFLCSWEIPCYQSAHPLAHLMYAVHSCVSKQGKGMQFSAVDRKIHLK